MLHSDYWHRKKAVEAGTATKPTRDNGEKQATESSHPDSTMPRGAVTKADARWPEIYAKACRALAWVDDNPDWWAAFRRDVLADIEAKRGLHAQDRAHNMRSKDFVNVNGNPSRFSNSMIPAFTRILVAELRSQGDEETAGRLESEMHGSVFDSEDMPWGQSK